MSSLLLIYFLTRLLPDLSIYSDPSRIDPFRFQAESRGGDQTWL